MELFRLLGTIAIDNSNANKALDETSEKGKNTESKLGKTFSAIGSGAAKVGKAVATGMAVGATAVAGLATKAIQSYADYEQLVGGVETLFGTRGAKSVEEYATIVGKSVEDVSAEFEMLQKAQAEVMDNADKAYKSAGLSANEYMETVTGIAAALKQSAASELEAAELADQAIIDMSDNANKMGSSMESIQNAYQGFAKQNYTMLDNLKLGYGGTKEEMQRLLKDAEKISGQKFDLSSYADIVEAIHVVQDEMGIAGTTAKEAASTISGSVGMMKSSWQNLMTALSSEEMDVSSYVTSFVNSVSTVGDNILPRINVVLDGIVQLVQQLAPKIIAKIPELVSQLLPSVLSATTSLINALVGVIPELVNALVSAIPAFIEGFVQIFNALVQALPTIMQSLISALPTLLPMLINGLVQMAVTLCTMIPQIIQPIIDNLPMIIISVVDALLSNLPLLIEGCVALVVGIVEALPQIALVLYEAMPSVILSCAEGLLSALPVLLKAWGDIWNSVGTAVAKYVTGIRESAIKGFNLMKERGSETFNKFKNKCSEIFNNIKEKITTSINNAKEKVVSTFSNLKSNAESKIESMRSSVASKFESIKSKIITPIETAKSKIKSIVDTIKGFFSGMKISFPKISMPHFKIKPSGWKIGDLLKGKIPSLSIDWYEKAMNKPMIMTKPTVFGYNAATGQLMGGGEAGSEVVAGTNTLMNMISNAVAMQNEALVYYLQKIIDVLATYFPQVIEALDMDVVLNDGVLVGRLAPAMDLELGKIKTRKDRGR